jgi:hypothetical protein
VDVINQYQVKISNRFVALSNIYDDDDDDDDNDDDDDDDVNIDMAWNVLENIRKLHPERA